MKERKNTVLTKITLTISNAELLYLDFSNSIYMVWTWNVYVTRRRGCIFATIFL